MEREAKRAHTLEDKYADLDKRRVSETDEARETRDKLSKKSWLFSLLFLFFVFSLSLKKFQSPFLGQILKSLEDTIAEMRDELTTNQAKVSEVSDKRINKIKKK